MENIKEKFEDDLNENRFDLDDLRQEMLKDLEDKGKLQERYDGALQEYLENKNDKNAKSRYEHAAAEFAAADVNGRLDEILKDQAFAEAKLDTRAKRILAKFEKKWQNWEGINIYDKYLAEKAKDKLYGKVLFHNALSKFILKKGLSLKTGISLGLAGAGFLVGGFGAGLAGAAGTMMAVRRAFGGAMITSSAIARIESTGAKKGIKRIEQIKQDFNKKDVNNIEFFKQNSDEQDKIIADYEYSAAINSIDLDNDKIYQKMIDYRISRINDLAEVEQNKAEQKLIDVEKYIFDEIQNKNNALDKRFAKAGGRRVAKIAIAGAMGAATAILLPKAFVAARHSEEVRNLADSIGLTRFGWINEYLVGNTDSQKIILSQKLTEADSLNNILGDNVKIEEVPSKINNVIKSSSGNFGPKAETIGQAYKNIASQEFAQEKIISEATIKKGEGVINVLQRQLLSDPEQFGYDKSSGISAREWASKIANREGMKNYGDIWVKKPGEVAYVLEGNEKVGFNIKEVDPQTGEIIGAGNNMDDYEMKPIKKITHQDLGPKAKIEEIQYKHEYPFIKELEMNENVVDFENQYEDAVSIDDKKDVIKSFERYLEKDGKIENINQIDNPEMLKELSKSKNETISFIANDTKETLLSYGSPTERVVNFLQIENPTGKDLKIVRSAFEQYGKEKMKNLGNGVSNKARLFANYATQSDENFRSIIGTKNYLDNAFYDFNAKAGISKLPVKEIWQPRTEMIPDAKGNVIEKIFNVKPQSHPHKATDYLIDFGDDKVPEVVDEDTLRKVLNAKSNFNITENAIGPEPINIKQPESNFN